jgi:hypothetical protein
MPTQDSTRDALLAKAGPLALATGALVTAAQLVMWPFDTDDHVATTQSVVFQLAGAAYFLAFCMLMLTLVLAYTWQAREAGRLGVAAVALAVIGTMALAGDLWFESFAVPWLADEVPAAFDTEPSVLLGLGAISSYVLFAVGWALFGLASLRAGVFPRRTSLPRRRGRPTCSRRLRPSDGGRGRPRRRQCCTRGRTSSAKRWS